MNDESLRAETVVDGSASADARPAEPTAVDAARAETQTWLHTLAQYLRLQSIDFGENIVAGGEIASVTNEAFAEAKNLLDPEEPKFDLGDFDPQRGQRFSSWETARHSELGYESATIKLPKPSKIGVVVVDTKWHDGNQAQAAQLMVSKDGKAWIPIVMPIPLQGHSLHTLRVNNPEEWSYVQLVMIPDGGIARLRIYEDTPRELETLKPHDMYDPTAEGTLLTVRHPDKIEKPTKEPFKGPGADDIVYYRRCTDWKEPVNLASINLGAMIVDKSDQRYSHAENVLQDGAPQNMGDGWEQARFRMPLSEALHDGYREIWNHSEWLVISLSDRGLIESIRTDLRFFNFNSPKFMEVEACDLGSGESLENATWETAIPKTNVKKFASQADVELPLTKPIVATHLRVRIYPCGGVHRIRAAGRAIEQSSPLAA